MSRLSRALQEPLLHFLALGALIFGAYAWLGDSAGEQDVIVISRGQQTNLFETFARTWGRAPTPGEQADLIEEYLREELAYREAAVRELDRNDTVIRRRLRQKLELLAEDLVTLAPPTEAEIAASYAADAGKYRAETRYSLEQIHFSPDARGSAAEADARALLDRLREGTAVQDEALLGDSRVLPRELTLAGEREIASTFGEALVDALETLPPGEWQGPVRSGFGWHLVRVGERVPGELPPLAEIADRVRNEILVERRRTALDQLYANLAEQYSIRIEPLKQALDATVEGAE